MDEYATLKLKKSSCDTHSTSSPLQLRKPSSSTEDITEDGEDNVNNINAKDFFSHSNLRKFAIDISLWINISITAVKAVAYLETSSLSILAALVDSVLDVVSQFILAYTEHRSSKSRSSAHYPAGAARLEPVGVLSCAALMGFASLGVLKESLEKLYIGVIEDESIMGDEDWSSFWSMFSIVVVKLGLYWLCQKVGTVKTAEAAASNNGDTVTEGAATTSYYVDSTMEALAQDHWNDCLSNVVAAVALFCTFSNEHLWVLDPIGAIFISCYIIFSWYATGKEQIEHLTGKAAPRDFIEELHEMANNFDPKMVVSANCSRIYMISFNANSFLFLKVDVVRAYHFGPKFLVELEVVLPRDTLLHESHDLGMELQYEIESREEVERCFVHIDYESRPYDEHVVSKVPELRERYRPFKQMTSAVSI